MDGRIQHVELTDKATSMSEAQLADEIFVIADLARQRRGRRSTRSWWRTSVN